MKRLPVPLPVPVATAFAAVALSAVAGAQAALPGPLVSTQWLADNLSKVQVVEVRTDPRTTQRAAVLGLDDRGQRRIVEFGGHIPGAKIVPAATLRTSRVIDGRKIDLVLPNRSEFEAIARAGGVDADRAIVVVGEGRSTSDLNDAARAYLASKRYASEPVAMLDGGMATWLNEGRPWSIKTAPAKEGLWLATADRSAQYLATSGDTYAAAAQAKPIADIRPAPMFYALTKRDFVSAYGHIPGAKMVPPEVLVTPRGEALVFRQPDEYKSMLTALGIDPAAPVITYCNSGNDAALAWFVFAEIMGNREARSYEGSLRPWTVEKRPTVAIMPPQQ